MSGSSPIKISIAMATYNGEKYLQQQLHSFVQQTRQPDELVVTDDCSTDATLQILEAFAQSAPFDVVVRRNEHNYGYCGNFNQALLRTTGDLVFISDQDDFWFPTKIEHVSSFAMQTPDALAFLHDASITDAHLLPVGITKCGQLTAVGKDVEEFMTGCCSAVRRELLNICLPIPDNFTAHDKWLIGIASGMKRKVFLEANLQYYRRHDQNVSQTLFNRPKRLTRFSLLFNEVKEKFFRKNHRELERIIVANAIKENQILEEWANKALQNNHLRYRADIAQLKEKISLTLKAFEAREDIRQQSVVSRPFFIYKAINDGTYGYFSGWKSAFRDLLGP